jgi:hypothetical protein
MSAAPGVPEGRAHNGRRPRLVPPLAVACSAQPLVRQPFPAPSVGSSGDLWAPGIEEIWEDARRGRLAEAIMTAVQGACTAARMDDDWWQTMWSIAAARLLLAAGQLRSARSAALCALHMPSTTRGSALAQFAARDVLARVAMATGDPLGLLDAARDVNLLTASPLDEVRAEGRWLGVLLHGRLSASSDDGGQLALIGVPPSTWFGAAPEVCDDAVLARCLTQEGRQAEAEALLSAAADRTTLQPDCWDVPATHHAVAGLVRHDARASARAAFLFDRCGRRLASAAAREDAAAALGPGGGNRRTQLLADALSTYDRAGAQAEAARVRTTLDGRSAHRSIPGASRS